MKFKIYEAEKNLGLEMKIRANASIAYITPTIPEKQLMKAALETKVVDDTLYPIVDILVSAGDKHGWNLNDDVFSAQATWDARNTPLFKPLDKEHDQNDIIGAIIATRVVDDDLNIIDESAYNEGECPTSFHILNESVIYRTWSDEDKLKEVDELIEEIKAGKWYMSMEAQFWGFDYRVEAPDGTQFTIARNDDTAFLSAYLRAYDGKGYYTDASTGDKYKIGRQMAHINFVGKGLVESPGNPKSVILSTASEKPKNELVYSNRDETLQTSTIEEITTMEDKDKIAYETRIAELEAQLKEKNEAVTASLKTDLEKVKADLAGANDKVDALEKSKAEIEKTKTELEAELAKIQDELKAAKDKEDKANRKKKMVDAGFSDEDAEAKVSNYASMDEVAFDAVMADIAAINKKIAPAPVETAEEAAAKLLANATPTAKTPVPTPVAEVKANKFADKVGGIFASTKNKKKD